MPGGRPPKPTAVKKLEGNPGKRPLNKREPKPQLLGDVPACPRHLKADARKEWERVARELHMCNVLSELELSLLEMYCESVARVKQAQKAWKDIDLSKLDSPGAKQKVRVLGSVLRDATAQAKAIAGELGITPSSRSRLTDGGATIGSGNGGNAESKPRDSDQLFDY